jgi:mRNA interferase MazF
VVRDKKYIPDRGDIVWLDFNPQPGHEQYGRRPALVITSRKYNSKSNLAIFCPITNRGKNYPFEVRIPEESGVSGLILSDQIKNLDWNARNIEFICQLPKNALEETLSKINALITFE